MSVVSYCDSGGDFAGGCSVNESNLTETGTSPSVVICKEVFDDNYQPSNDEIKDYAIKIGIDPIKEGHLLYLAREGLMQALPNDWQPCYNEKYESYYYYNRRTKVTQWDHPLDAEYRLIVDKKRRELNNLQLDIISSDDLSQIDSGIKSLQYNDDVTELTGTPTQPSSSTTAGLHNNIFDINSIGINNFCGVIPLNGRIMTTFGNKMINNDKKLLEPLIGHKFEVIKVPTDENKIPIKIDLNMKNNRMKIQTQYNSNEDINGIIGGSGDGGLFNNKINNKEIKGFTLTGQGAMFLKSNKNLISSNSSKPIDIINKTTTKLNDNNILCTSPTVKGILRDSSLTDIRYRNNHNNNNNNNNNNTINNIINTNNGDDNDDKKSVRFDLNNKYDLSTEDDNSEEDVQGQSPLDEQQQQELMNKIKEKRLLYQKSEGTFMHSIKHLDKNGAGIEEQNDVVSDEESEDESSKENDDNIIDDAWDFMQDDDDDGDINDDEEAAGHVKDITIIPNKQKLTNKLGKTLSNDLTITNTPTESSEDTVKKPLKLFNKADSNLIMLTKTDLLTKQNFIKPLYHDSDSCDSQVDIIKNLPNDNQQTKQNDISENLLRQQMEIRLNEYRKQLIDNENVEINILKEKSKELIEKLMVKEKENYENDMKIRLNDEKIYYENLLKIELQKLKENYDKILKENEENITSNANKTIQQLNDEEMKKINLLKCELDEKLEKEFNEYKIQLKLEFDDKRNEIINEHKKSVDILQRNHTEILQELERDLKTEEELLRKEHTTNLSHLKDKLTHEMDLERQRMRDTGEDRLYEKIRCEKRLLEDKYRCLKEKYIRLKTDVKLSLERRNNRRREQQLQQQSLTNTTGSETERSNSNKQGMIIEHGKPPVTPKHHVRGRDIHQIQPSSLSSSIVRDKSPLPAGIQSNLSGNNAVNSSKDKKFGAAAKYIKHLQQHYQGDDTTSISQSDTTISNNCNRNRYNVQDNDNSDNSEALCNNQYNNNLNNNNITNNNNNNNNTNSNTANTNNNNNIINNNNNNNNNNNVKDTPGRQRRKIFSRMKSASTSRLNSTNNQKVNEIGRPCTPVENLRRQLQKLEDLEDQFPDNTLDTTYHLRYPFSDVVNNYQSGTSSELEFFKHRIHLERDSVRRAKESLRTQRSNFRARQREIKQRHKNIGRSHTLDQLIHEEKELTEMEVNLHRTRALLGEKVIRLRHLEQSLQRLYDKEKPFLSDFLTSTGTEDNRGRGVILLGTEQIHKDDATLSDLSSHSSSGFSSTDFGGHTDTNHGVRNKEMYQESSEIIQSLENLNAEIREIWDILSKQQAHGLPPPPPPSMLYTASATAIAAAAAAGVGGGGNGQSETLGWPVASNTLQQHQTTAQQSTQQMTSNGLLAHNNQHHQQTVIPTLADRLETYRQMAAAGRTTTNPTLATLIGGGSGGSGVGLSNIVTTSTVGIGGPVNMIVSQSPLAAHYTTSLVERTRDLRNWLRQAKNEHEQIFGVVGGVGGVGGVSGGSGMGGTANNPGNNLSINGGSKIGSSAINNGQQGAQL